MGGKTRGYARSTCGFYTFASPACRESVYNRIAPKDKQIQHTAIENMYRQDMETAGVYRVVAHLALAVDSLSPKGKEAFARLCLQAGVAESQWSAFALASKYLDLGIHSLDPKQKWKSQYELTIAPFCDFAEMCSFLGEFDDKNKRLMEALNHAKDASHKLRANTIQIQSLVTQTQHADAIALGLKVLQRLHEPVKKHFLDTELLKSTLKLLEGKTEECILSSRIMTDENSLGAMNIMNLLVASPFVAQGELVPLLACRMVRVTLKHGITGTSAVGLSALGISLCCAGEIKESVACSEIGLEPVETIEDKDYYKGRVMVIHWGLLSRFVKPWSIYQEPLKVMASRLCKEGNDNEVRSHLGYYSAYKRNEMKVLKQRSISQSYRIVKF
jgi:hypothetical protein